MKGEILGYTAQYAYDPNGMPNYIKKITDVDMKYIAGIRDKEGNVVYPGIYKRNENFKKQAKVKSK